MKTLSSFVGGALLTAGLLGVMALHLPLALLATLGVAAGCLVWLVVIVVLPWNLYFQARHLLFEMGRSRERGLPVSAAHEAQTQRVQRRMLRISVGLHLVSAALVALGSWWSNEPLGSAFAALFLLSTLFRPAVEYYRYLRRQLTDVLQEVKYPREDVAKLLRDVEQAKKDLREQHDAQLELTRELAQVKQESVARSNDAHRRLDLVARKFDESLDKLTDNREVISGLKAFLRLIREPSNDAVTAR
jgi:apolipoprotein N-acyltransferase